MKFLLLALVSLSLLSACPTTEGGPQVNESSPAGRPIVFKHTEISCCWEALKALAQKQGIDYSSQITKALKGDAAALEQLLLFSKQVDLQTSAPHAVVVVTLLYALGDQIFANSLQKLAERGELKQEHPIFQETLKETLRNLLETGSAFSSNPALKDYSLQHYHRTSALLSYTAQTAQ